MRIKSDGMRIKLIGVVGAAGVLATVAAGPSPAAGQGTQAAVAEKPVRVANVHGSARIRYVESPDDDIRFTVDAESVPFSRPLPHPMARNGMATDARGTVKFSHGVPNGGEAAVAEARVDCLVTSGRTATLTAVITKSSVGRVGKRIGISVQQGRKGEPDRLGFSWGVVNVDPEGSDEAGEIVESEVGTCMAPAPFTVVKKGGFKVVHADLPKTPAPAAEARRD
ncbi:hypothetical protein [Streptomyces sp. KLOTTS4A1]|uniref:hypothetical protein n=1 Tax=Streptomyces sp. KLOTTS4A1 TaxID=3390996 RepID=UPI0039F48164